MCRFLCRKPRRNESSFLVFVRKGRLRQPPGRPQAKEVQTRLGLVRGNTRRNRAERCARPCAQSYMYATLRERMLDEACPQTHVPPTALFGSPARSARGERVQKAGAIGGGAALSTRGAAPGRCDDACRTYRHHISTVEGFEVCLRGRRPLASRRSRTTAPFTAHATRC
eukprot:scaffold22247_cov73-Phaeocystis_antarctica.AAC.1